AVGENFLVQCTGTVALDQLTKIANGEVKFEHQGIGMRAAALRFQGLRGTSGDRALLEHNLAAAEMPIRLACADALRMLADEEAVVPLAAAVDRESNEVALGALAQALRACFGKYMTPPVAGDDGLPARGGRDKDSKDGRPP